LHVSDLTTNTVELKLDKRAYVIQRICYTRRGLFFQSVVVLQVRVCMFQTGGLLLTGFPHCSSLAVFQWEQGLSKERDGEREIAVKNSAINITSYSGSTITPVILTPLAGMVP
jgi:hypothetical protein